MNRDRNGRFIKNNEIEISIPSPMTICKMIIAVIFLLPWIYIIFFRFEILKFIEELLIFLMEPKDEKNCENADSKQRTPY